MSLAVTAKPAPSPAPTSKSAPADAAPAKAATDKPAADKPATEKQATEKPAAPIVDAPSASASSMSPTASTAIASPGVASAPIPFRKTSVTSGPEIFGTLLITLLVLAGFAGLAWYARRRGWLDRWISQAPSAVAGNRKLQVIEVLHVSRKTTVFRIRDGEQEMLLTESSVQTQLTPSRAEAVQP